MSATKTSSNKKKSGAAKPNKANTKSSRPSASAASKTPGKSSGSRAASSGNKARRSGQKKTLSGEVQGIMLIALGLILACAFFLPAGVVGEFVRNVCFGLFGAASSVFFVFFLIAGVNCFADKRPDNSLYKWWVLLGLMVCSGVIYALAKGDTSFAEGGFTANMRALYEGGINGSGGGIISGALCKTIVFLIGSMAAWVCAVAATLVQLVILTGFSIEKAVRWLVGFAKRTRDSFAERVGSEVEILPENPEESDEKRRQAELKRRRRETRRAERAARRAERKGKNAGSSAPPRRQPRDTVIDIPIDDRPEIPETPVKPRRFVIEEDEDHQKFSLDDLPFDLGEIKSGTIEEVMDAAELIDPAVTGALTNLPDEDGNIPKDNTGDNFEPPTEAQLEDRLDPMTKKALRSGVPMDEAVVKGRKMLLDEDAPVEDKIAAEIEKQSSVQRPVYYRLPYIELLSKPNERKKTRAEIRAELEEKGNRLLDTLSSFKVDARIVNITQGPSVTRFELQPGVGVKVSKITSLADDIALSLAASGVRIEAPIPGKSAIGIEIPNARPSAVSIREVLDTPEFRGKRSKTAVALGKDISGSCVIADIADFPHILIAGATGSGKSVCINSLITSILYKAKPNEVKMIMVDPKMVELGVYNGIPHLLIPVVTDPKHAAGALNWAVAEMQNRYNLLRDNKVRNLEGYNKLMEENGEPDSMLPEIVIIIDELADLMTVAKSEVEEAINRLAALARAAGMYLVIATQRPSVNVITGVIKANIPSRIAFAVSSQIDSRTIIDSAGAEKLLGRGDMLYSPRGAMKPLRVQGNFVSDSEIETLVDYIKSQYEAEYDEDIIEHIEKEHERVAADLENDAAQVQSRHESGGRLDDMFLEAAELVLENGQASVAMFQRKFKMGYQRAAKLIDQMEEMKVIGPYEGTKPRQVLITRQELNEMKFNHDK